jgi:Na+-transporting NADH:ubiquinone oxidoreductase subunit NqrC
MKKLWKDNGGYALAYVLIVVLVLCAVAVSVCTAALKNYQAQERSIRQTQQLYQAEGEIERFVALAEDVHLLEYSTKRGTKEAAEKEARDAYLTYLQGLQSEVNGCKFDRDRTETGSNSCTFTLTCKNAAVRIETKIRMDLEYSVTEIPPDETSKTTMYTAKVSKATHSYNTYTITHLTAEGGASG